MKKLLFVKASDVMVWTLCKMRKDGDFPAEPCFKTSAHLGHCNPASITLLQEFGTDSINLVRDLQLPMIAAIRFVGCCHKYIGEDGMPIVGSVHLN